MRSDRRTDGRRRGWLSESLVRRLLLMALSSVFVLALHSFPLAERSWVTAAEVPPLFRGARGLQLWRNFIQGAPTQINRGQSGLRAWWLLLPITWAVHWSERENGAETGGSMRGLWWVLSVPDRRANFLLNDEKRLRSGQETGLFLLSSRTL